MVVIKYRHQTKSKIQNFWIAGTFYILKCTPSTIHICSDDQLPYHISESNIVVKFSYSCHVGTKSSKVRA